MEKRSSLILCALVVLFTVSSVGAVELTVWPADSLEKMFPDAQPPEQPSEMIRLRAAQDEYESAQLAVRADQKIEDLRVTVSPLKRAEGGEIPTSNIRARFVGAIPIRANSPSAKPDQLICKAPCEVPDVLLEDASISLDPGRTQGVWITVHVPVDAPPSLYSGEVRITADAQEATVPIQLEVLPFAIPVERHLQVTNWINWSNIAKHHGLERWSEPYWKLLETYAANWRAHRQNVVMADIGLIDCHVTKDGLLECDYERFDRLVELLERAGVLDRLELPFMASHGPGGWSSREIVLRKISAESRETGKRVSLPPDQGLKPFLGQLQAHLADKQWLDKTIMHVCDEPAAHNLESWREASRFIHEAAPKIARIDAIETTGFGDELEVWVPKLNHLSNWFDHYREMQRRGKELWFYTCCHPWGYYPNRFLDQPLIETRVLHWMNWHAGATGYLHWGLLAWTDDPFQDAGEPRLPPGDRCIVYPGGGGPLDSIRWEQMRDGIEDYECLWLLRARMKEIQRRLGPAAADMDAAEPSDAFCAQIVRSFTDYAKQPERLRAVRQQLQDAIVQATEPPLVMLRLEPRAGHELVAGPISVIVRGIVEQGSTVKVNGQDVSITKQGTFVRQFGTSSGEIIVDVAGNGGTKRLTRTYTVR